MYGEEGGGGATGGGECEAGGEEEEEEEVEVELELELELEEFWGGFSTFSSSPFFPPPHSLSACLRHQPKPGQVSSMLHCSPSRSPPLNIPLHKHLEEQVCLFRLL